MKILTKESTGTEQKKLVLVTGIHGNEASLFEPLKKSLEEFSSESITVTLILANELAAQKNVRYIDQDLNRSFTKDFLVENNETKIVKNLFLYCRGDFIIDFHTHSGEEQFALVSKKHFNGSVKDLIQYIDIKNCILLADSVVGNVSLISNFENSLTIEAGRHATPQAGDFAVNCFHKVVQYLEGEIKEKKVDKVNFLDAKRFFYNTTTEDYFLHHPLLNFKKIQEEVLLPGGKLFPGTVPVLISYRSKPGKKILLICETLEE